ncbi:hypothetical protein AU192_01295 [Mycobacterium lehmannii]|uniref:Flagellar hook-length control protein n=1 Tax=Mycobacterium lehmannii TaxID=2048550 RepID=A0A101A1Z7_9MYCO|nr:hypothetical protein [Mycobacterium lehmannii]KUI11446.1 hypothetical protein AU192_01295 [Mycobacterium lehmannii]
MTTTEDVIRAAASVGRDAAEGRLSPAELDQEVADQCRALFGIVAGPDDPLWPLHQDISRQSIAAGALSADELSEWAAVIRRREAVGTVDASERSAGTDASSEADSSASEPLSPGNLRPEVDG